jgi:phosphoribosylanthranilate isomerase
VLADFVMPRIKVCGVRAIEDLPAPLDTGLEAVGFVAWVGSPRCVAVEAAASVVALLPTRVLPIAVMVDEDPARALRWLVTSGARAVQLCGAETPSDWLDFPHPILRRIPTNLAGVRDMDEWLGVARGFVIDHPSGPGGTGRSVRIGLARRMAQHAPCLLAGGLDPSNVGGLIARVRPHGVDASSRLELAPGRKDPVRVRAFVTAAREAFEAGPT